MDAYDTVSKGALKLKKGTGESVSKKSKKKKKDKHREPQPGVIQQEKKELPQSAPVLKTKAEIAFQQMQEDRKKEILKQRASKTHKQRVEEFNRHLDNLTEHFDIPKVSWTK
ncbi:unnamed protein product, partial [Cyprideis torosa]